MTDAPAKSGGFSFGGPQPAAVVATTPAPMGTTAAAPAPTQSASNLFVFGTKSDSSSSSMKPTGVTSTGPITLGKRSEPSEDEDRGSGAKKGKGGGC